MNSVLNQTVSCYKSAGTGEPPKPVNLLTWLHSQKYREAVEAIRREEDEERRKKMKKALPLISTAGIFSGKEIKDLQQYTGLLCIDLDHVEHLQGKKQFLCALPYVAYCGISCSGTGLFAIVRVSDQPGAYTLHHRALELDIPGIDPSGRAVNRQRYYSYDPEPYFNHTPETYYKLYEEEKYTAPDTSYNAPSTYARLLDQIQQAKAKNIDLTQSDYLIRLKIGFALVSEFGEEGRTLFHEICSVSPKYNAKECNKKYTDLLRTNPQIKIGYLFKILQNI